ncbi:uncharacterized protein LOC144004902 [Festucalex cinctus]
MKRFGVGRLQVEATTTIQSDSRSNDMKTVLVALLVFVLVSQGEALTCYCEGKSACFEPLETCRYNEVCSKVMFQVDSSTTFIKGCTWKNYCSLSGTSSCCETDLCNV